jgi:undecaprenyl-diphosphatase
MDFLQLILLGLVQGVAEWLPISSKSQVMLLLIGLFGIAPADSLSLSLFLHIGTLAAVTVYFRKEILKIIEMREPKLLLFLFLSTLVAAPVGVPLFLLFRETFASSTGEFAIGVIGAGLIITGVVFLISKERKRRSYTRAGIVDSLVAGFSQSLSVLPGVSRSGMTTASLLFLGFSQEDSLKLSLLMSIPFVFGAEVVFSLLEGLPKLTLAEASVSLLSSFVFGFISIAIFLKLARKINFGYFCILLGVISLIPLLQLW